MLWQASYAEFYFPKTYFPDFNEEEFDKAILEYTKRDRRFGGVKEEGWYVFKKAYKWDYSCYPCLYSYL